MNSTEKDDLNEGQLNEDNIQKENMNSEEIEIEDRYKFGWSLSLIHI